MMARILVIEDNMANLDLMVYLLTAFGHRTLAAEDGEMGVQIARREHPDAIICDIQLPKKDGYTVARELKEDRSFPSIPLVAVTAFAMVGDRDQVLAAGFDGYISKPIVPETFVSQVEQFLAPRQRAPSLPSYAQALPQSAVAQPLPVLSMVLLVDDSEVNLQLMCSMLEPFGYRTMVAHSVDQALALAHQRTPDLVISDLHMPGRSGFDLICAFKADSALEKIKIIIHSATMRSELDRREALRLGATQCIIRPIEPQMLLEAIDSCLRNEQER